MCSHLSFVFDFFDLLEVPADVLRSYLVSLDRNFSLEEGVAPDLEQEDLRDEVVPDVVQRRMSSVWRKLQ